MLAIGVYKRGKTCYNALALVRKWVGEELAVLENRLNELIPKQNRGKAGDFKVLTRRG